MAKGRPGWRKGESKTRLATGRSWTGNREVSVRREEVVGPRWDQNGRNALLLAALGSAPPVRLPLTLSLLRLRSLPPTSTMSSSRKFLCPLSCSSARPVLSWHPTRLPSLGSFPWPPPRAPQTHQARTQQRGTRASDSLPWGSSWCWDTPPHPLFPSPRVFNPSPFPPCFP